MSPSKETNEDAFAISLNETSSSQWLLAKQMTLIQGQILPANEHRQLPVISSQGSIMDKVSGLCISHIIC